MVGRGVLRECLNAPDVTQVVAVGRTFIGIQHAKLKEIRHRNLFDLTSITTELNGFQACLFTVGVSSSGMKDETYRHLTFDLTLSIAELLAKHNPDMIFVYVSGVGTDETESSSTMWARVKGRTENALRRLPFKAAYSFRPAAIVPIHGEKSKNAPLRYFYVATGWLLLLLRHKARGYILTTEDVGGAMLNVVRHGWDKPVLEPADILAAATMDYSYSLSTPAPRPSETDDWSDGEHRSPHR